MGRSNGRESCGRCSFTTVIDALESGGDADGEGAGERESRSEGDDGENRTRYDPFAGGAIEVDERELRLVSAPAVLAGRLKRRLDETAHRLIYGESR